MSSPPKLIQFVNCRLVRNHQMQKEDLWIRGGKIINPECVFFDEQVKADQQIDCKYAIIAPGFIDLQINGGYGIDFSYDTDSVESGILTVAKGIIQHGVTSFCPTLVTSPESTYKKVIPNIPKTSTGANILGLHLEGPFINPKKKGAHDEKSLKTFNKGLETLKETYGESMENVKIITLAPELDTTGELVKHLVSKNIVVSLGHSMANLCDGEEAVKNGATLITHLFNAMLPFHHRDPGLVGLLASDQIPARTTVFFGIIADGVHTHPAALRIAHRTHPDGLILVTDAISALGLEEGVHHIGQLAMQVRNGQAFIAGTNTLCGSIAPMDECVRLFKKATDCSTVYAIETVTLHPARCLKMEHKKGSLNYGSDADFVLLNDNLNVLSTWIAGECVYKNQ